GRDQAPIGDQADPADREPVAEVVEYGRQCGEVAGVAQPDPMCDEQPVAGARLTKPMELCFAATARIRSPA
ncbi:MAG: hypothetical protein OEY41_02460, partial [Acidimicrobiia bacterium]|nr:hypothetical protein [Acidimicrobiia bacterium]